MRPQGSPYFDMIWLARLVHSRGDPCGRPEIAWRLITPVLFILMPYDEKTRQRYSRAQFRLSERAVARIHRYQGFPSDWYDNVTIPASYP